jgi:hypothetical protein
VRAITSCVADLYKTERIFCQNLVIIKQLYYTGLQREAVLSDEHLQRLIPEHIFTPFINFHIQFLRELKYERDQQPVFRNYNQLLIKTVTITLCTFVYTLCLQFDKASERRRDAVHAHVRLGSLFNGQHELNVQRYYERLLVDNPRFAAFIKV